MTFTLPVQLVESLRLNPTPERRQWVAELPDTVHGLAQRWSLRLGPPYQPGGECSWVAPAAETNGRQLVLKVGWRHNEATHEPDALRSWAGNGAVRLHTARTTATTIAMLLERCRPGTTLGQPLPEPQQDVVLAGLLRRLWITPTTDHPFRPLQSMCDAWANEFEQQQAYTPTMIDPGLARAAIELFRSLPATAEHHVLRCTDLHAGNILAAQRQPWLAIDPKPYLGDPAYDTTQHLLNCTNRLHTDPAGLARRMAQLIGLPTDQVTQWLFARSVQESINQPALRQVATTLAPR